MNIEPFILRAIMAGVGLALVSGPLGCFVVWKRMAYFGDSLSHSALLGVALGVLLGIDIHLAVVGFAVVFAMLILWLQQQRILAIDTLLGILSHAALALGIVAFSLMSHMRIDLFGFLFGDILSVSYRDLWWIYSGGAIVLIVLMSVWSKLLLLSLHEDLAKAEGVRVFLVNLIFMLLMAIVIAMAMRMVGVLLITALLIIPAASARQLARTPEQMAILAAGTGIVAVIIGVLSSLSVDIPSGPSIIVSATGLFLLLLLVRIFFFKSRQG